MEKRNKKSNREQHIHRQHVNSTICDMISVRFYVFNVNMRVAMTSSYQFECIREGDAWRRFTFNL